PERPRAFARSHSEHTRHEPSTAPGPIDARRDHAISGRARNRAQRRFLHPIASPAARSLSPNRRPLVVLAIGARDGSPAKAPRERRAVVAILTPARACHQGSLAHAGAHRVTARSGPHADKGRRAEAG